MKTQVQARTLEAVIVAGWGLPCAFREEEGKPGIPGRVWQRVPGTLENSVSRKQTHRTGQTTGSAGVSRLSWLPLLFHDAKIYRTRVSTF